MLKTGIAVTLALYITEWFHLTSPVIAAVAAIFAMQPSIYRSWRYLIEQLQTNTLGAIIALLAGMVFSKEPIAVGLVCVVVIMICLKLNMGDTIGLTLVTVVAVMEASGQWQFALTRFSLSLVGILSAFLINLLLFPPKPRVQFVGQVRHIFDKLSLLMRTVISDEIRENVFRNEKRGLEDAINSLSDKFKLMEEDLKKLKKPKFSESRQLVVYKQMLKTLRKGYEVLDAVEQHYFQADRPEQLNQDFDAHLERLIRFHEHILLKFDDKLKPNYLEADLLEKDNDEFLRKMHEHYAEKKIGILRLSIVSAEMYDYGHQLERLNRLADHSPLVMEEQGMT
nr:aromatic acid exporter family protein [Paenibacillus shirakamiensis]